MKSKGKKVSSKTSNLVSESVKIQTNKIKELLKELGEEVKSNKMKTA